MCVFLCVFPASFCVCLYIILSICCQFIIVVVAINLLICHLHNISRPVITYVYIVQYNYIFYLILVFASVARFGVVFPDAQTLQYARAAIVRLQTTYNISVASLTSSAWGNITTEDCIAFADWSISHGLRHLHNDWLKFGQTINPIDSVNSVSRYYPCYLPRIYLLKIYNKMYIFNTIYWSFLYINNNRFVQR